MQFYQEQYIPAKNTLELYFAGCNQHCANCQNPELWNFNAGYDMSVESIISGHVKPYMDAPIKQIHILGGEPLEQPHNELLSLCGIAKGLLGGKVIVFTGETLISRKHGHEFFFTSHNQSYGHEITVCGAAIDYFKVGSYLEGRPKAPMNELGFELITDNQYLVKVEYGVE